MAIQRSAKIYPHLWFTSEAEEAADLYTSIFPDSHVDRVTTMPSESPSGPAGTVKVVDFTLFGQPFQAMSARGKEPFNSAISLVVTCDDQAELDRYWDALSKDGGKPMACGWIQDRFGVSWQIVPGMIDVWMDDQDRERAKRVTDAMLKMIKLDEATLKAAYDGEG